jgi:hypothetical protein
MWTGVSGVWTGAWSGVRWQERTHGWWTRRRLVSAARHYVSIVLLYQESEQSESARVLARGSFRAERQYLYVGTSFCTLVPVKQVN